MPIEHTIDHARRLVMARGCGIVSDRDVFSYQREVWSRPDVIGYNELVDMTAVEHIDVPSGDRIRELAKLAAGMDLSASKSKFAIVAPQDVAFGLGRMFQTFRGLETRSMKEVAVFRSLVEAFAFLGIEATPERKSSV